MSVKDDFLDGLNASPSGVEQYLETPIPSPPACSPPEDVDAAIIANGLLSCYLLDVFRAFAGLTPVEMLLRIGQRSNTAQALLMSALEYVQAVSDFVVVAPIEGQSYYGMFADWQVTGAALESVSVTVGDESFPMSGDKNTFTANWPIPIGSWNAVFTAETLQGQIKSKQISFQVVSWDTFPANGETYTSVDELIVYGPLDAVQSIVATVTNITTQEESTHTLGPDGDNYSAAIGSLEPGEWKAEFSLSMLDIAEAIVVTALFFI